MDMTPEDIRAVTFRKPAFGRRGYDEAAVDAFLDRVTEAVAGMRNRIADLERQLASRPPRP
ncbi:DivIVA domain-containing protein [Corynebacterium sp.]|uniref:DivIVA domain-containing protein n=1 Tax=Corynebacterium sp. TaxID=1720 RepID=UPI0025C2398C|nr:DivIVA domain-containing protein [Corynebacterium sp.]